MRRALVVILIFASCACPAADRAEAGESRKRGRRVEPSRDAPLGSIARQLDLKFRMMRKAGGTLTAALRHNRKEWESLTPDQREHYRRMALAFLKTNPDEQEKMLKRYEKLIKLSARKRDAYRRRAQWLKVVVASFTPEQRKWLKSLSPRQRARRLIERRDELVKQGKLKLDRPAGRKRKDGSRRNRNRQGDKSRAVSTTQPAAEATGR